MNGSCRRGAGHQKLLLRGAVVLRHMVMSVIQLCPSYIKRHPDILPQRSTKSYLRGPDWRFIDLITQTSMTSVVHN
jgi:hypothetical protein